ncbi:MAG: TonB-dependent receptor [Rhodocyclaceae bacterium]|nr:TonB-dependent receptor [Rhodocyclaceae bacterium]
MRLPFRPLIRSLCALVASGGVLAAELSEQDYFSELPVVLTVSRLAQPLAETPGAVTIIDREIIRRSGAREVADLLRLVPGYLVSGRNGANPSATYHAPLDDYGVRNLVLIDGRPVYSTFYIGGTHQGMMGVLLEDIERIEVLRGSNSAAYGANALFGVINIITRHTADTQGAEVSVTGGGAGVNDNLARIGWGNEAASFRLSTGRRSDTGYSNVNDDKIVSQLHLRGDLRPAADNELMAKVGVTQLSAGEGVPGSVGNSLRAVYRRDFYLQGQWRRQLSATEEITLSASFDEEVFRDAVPYALDPSVTLDSGGRGRRTNLEFQHQLGISPELRVVWGAGYKYEEALSPPLYAQQAAVSFHEERLFGNFEWRPHPQWLINAGGFWGRHSLKGGYFSPRLMANLHVLPDHTLRAGVTESTRMPTLFELAGDVRYYPRSTAATNPYRWFAFFNLPVRTIVASGNLEPESLYTEEVGYFGNFRDWRMTLDVRGFIERMRDSVGNGVRTIPGYVLPVAPFTPIPVRDFVSGSGFKIRGLEYQLRWKPLNDTEIWVNQTFEKFVHDATYAERFPPTRFTTLALFQKLPHDFDLSVMWHATGAMSYARNIASDILPAMQRVDLRLAYPFRVGSTRAEAAVTVQAADGSHPEYRPFYLFDRRAYGTLRFTF